MYEYKVKNETDPKETEMSQNQQVKFHTKSSKSTFTQKKAGHTKARKSTSFTQIPAGQISHKNSRSKFTQKPGRQRSHKFEQVKIHTKVSRLKFMQIPTG